MKNWKDRFYRFLEGRNGMDDLSIFLIVVSLVLMILGSLLHGFVLTLIALGLLIYAYFRVFSRHLTARQEENRRYLAEREGLRLKLQSRKVQFANRKQYKYLKCKKCEKKMRVPRGKGRIEVTCPHCGEKFTTRS